MYFFTLWEQNRRKTSLVSLSPKFVRKYPSCEKILREIKMLWKLVWLTLMGRRQKRSRFAGTLERWGKEGLLKTGAPCPLPCLQATPSLEVHVKHGSLPSVGP
jgi:hypothetical protein